MPLGAWFAAACLVFTPVEIVPAPPANPGRGAGRVHYVTGSRDREKGVRWMLKRQQLFESAAREVVFNEDELNLWFAWEPVGRPLPGGSARREWVEIQGVDFRIADGALCIGLPSKIAIGPKRVPVLIQAKGGFSSRDAGLVMYAPDEVWVGSFPVHRVPWATRWLMSRLPGRQSMPGAGLELWQRILRVTITGRELHVKMNGGHS